MRTFVLIHGAGDAGWYWHLVEAELRARGHDVVAPDLPAGDPSAELADYADAVVEAVPGPLRHASHDSIISATMLVMLSDTHPEVQKRMDARAIVR
jgi:pimeloyl-ACP methyl ester carboxylesterase